MSSKIYRSIKIDYITIALFSILAICNHSHALTFDVIPSDMPPGIPKNINGNYRIIERNVSGTHWLVYDVKSYSRTKNGIRMYPPIFYFDTIDNGKTWLKERETKPIDTIYINELVNIINTKKEIKPKDSAEDTHLSGKNAETILRKKLKHQQDWSLVKKPFKGGYLLCGRHSKSSSAMPVWWAKEGKVYSVNGNAKGLTGHDFTFEINISEGLNACK